LQPLKCVDAILNNETTASFNALINIVINFRLEVHQYQHWYQLQYQSWQKVGSFADNVHTVNTNHPHG